MVWTARSTASVLVDTTAGTTLTSEPLSVARIGAIWVTARFP